MQKKIFKKILKCLKPVNSECSFWKIRKSKLKINRYPTSYSYCVHM